jgi:hypothetical protein
MSLDRFREEFGPLIQLEPPSLQIVTLPGAPGAVDTPRATP